MFGVFIFFIVNLIVVTVYGQIDRMSLTQFYAQWIPDIDFKVETGYGQLKLQDWSGLTNKVFYQIIYKAGSGTTGQVQSDDPFIIWLQGGPGCGGEFGQFYEIGPFIVSGNERVNYKVHLNDFSWNKKAHLLFIDQPFGAGFSFSDAKEIVSSTEQAASQFVAFMKLFFDQYQEFRNIPLYIFGESYAGHYIPSFTRALINSIKPLNFKGIGIGNGLTKAVDQVSYYGQYLFNSGVIGVDEFKNAISNQANIQTDIIIGSYVNSGNNLDALIESLSGKIIYPQNIKRRKNDPQMQIIQGFLTTYKNYWGVPDYVNPKAEFCNNTVYASFQDDITRDFSPDIEYLLTVGQVLIYNGQLDFTVNNPGKCVIQWVNKLNWDKIYEWRSSTKQSFGVNLKTVGTVKKYDNLSYVVIYNAGHLVPSDQPISSYYMLEHFLENDNYWQ